MNTGAGTLDSASARCVASASRTSEPSEPWPLSDETYPRPAHPGGSGRRDVEIRLTPREHEVLSLLTEGLGNKQIARAIGISEHGVKRHVTNLLAKLNCPNHTLAVARALPMWSHRAKRRHEDTKGFIDAAR